MEKPLRKPGLLERGIAERSKTGKLMLSNKGRDALFVASLKHVRGTNPHKTIRIVFFCPGGVESSHLAMKKFGDFARQQKPPVNLSLDFEGWYWKPEQKLVSILEKADFVVPIYGATRKTIDELCNGLKKKPIIASTNFDLLESQFDQQKYAELYKEIVSQLKK